MNKKLKVVVVEDDPILVKALSEGLEDEHYEVIKAFDGEDGLATILSQKPDLVLLDVVMPKMDGMTMMRKLRESGDYGKGVPVIFLTNLNVDDKISKRVAEDNPSYYLIKSKFTLKNVMEKVRSILGCSPT